MTVMTAEQPPAEHPSVPHPEILTPPPGINDQVFAWITKYFGASAPVFWIALIAPLLVIPASASVKLTLSVISGSWFQWWMLPALQRHQMRSDAARDAKSDADHSALTYVATQVDSILEKMAAP
jgi:hypothetical protein